MPNMDEPIAFASRYLNHADKTDKNYFCGELQLLALVWGLERFRFQLYGKQLELFSDHQALEPLLKKTKANKQYSVQLTRWLDRLNHFDITHKYTAGKEIKFTNFVSRNPTENVEPEKNYKEEFVINAIAHFATVNGRIEQIFNQSGNRNTDKTASMPEARAQTGTRRCKTHNRHSNLILTANQIDTGNSEHITHLQQRHLNDNINNRQNTNKFTHDGRIKYHWCADDEIIEIPNRWGNSPETRELVERRLELTRPGHMRYENIATGQSTSILWGLTNRVIEKKATRNRQQDENIRSDHLNFMLDLENLNKETAAVPDLIEVQCCLEDNYTLAIPEDYTHVAKTNPTLWKNKNDNRIIVPKSLRYAALKVIHFCHTRINKTCSDPTNVLWPNLRADIEKKTRTCSACLNAGKNLKTQLPNTENSKLEPTKSQKRKYILTLRGS